MKGPQEPRDLYELLGVGRDASAAEITRAWHRRARVLHPDVQPGRAGKPEGFEEVAAAYRVLRDPALRAAYDQTRPPAARPVPVAGPRVGWPGSRPPGPALWAGPVQVSPPPGAVFADYQADARLALLAALLARHFGAVAGGDWPW